MLPESVPDMKLVPIIKLIGKLTVLFIKKFTRPFVELFWIPITKTKNKQELNTKEFISFWMV